MMMAPPSHSVSRTPGNCTVVPQWTEPGERASSAPASSGPTVRAITRHSRTSVYRVANTRPRISSETFYWMSVNPMTYTPPAKITMMATNSRANGSDDIDAASTSAAPAPSTAQGNSRSFGTRFWTTDSPSTPMATPVPMAVSRRLKPVSPEPRTFEANVGPNGTTMPPPMSPVPSPIITERTTGLVPM